ncbi:PEPxxWA-CTERM sorting domain-containing protein [Sphingobium lignivorans]|uniref:Ice-binding protein C-terminal domain-containing protein n=1 Tax=Sphingobium lignivorans TaxID=2735886 RepID=A0ABR6NA45_9SPHN|nr:PEPxxWA-CTERM sorting domain-containing protein [Sphingobium lignivorans]MBB5984133.1 hypothetical protein [Sphingobium lignivorans]
MFVKNFVLAAMAGTSLMALPSAAGAVSVLDFSGNICGAAGNEACGNGSAIGQNYGDIAGQVDVSYRSFNSSTGVTYESFLKHWAAGYGDLLNIVWGGSGPTVHASEIIFTAAAGYEVSLISLDFGCYQNRSSCQTINYDISSLGGTVIAAGSAPTLYPTHGTLAVDSGWFSDGIKLVWGPDAYDVGLDNIRFDVRAIEDVPPPAAVPEPASWAMMIAGLGVVGSALRRRRVRLSFA